MAETSIDRLTLDIVVNNDNATRRINNITKAIEKLNTAMGKSGNIDKVLEKINNVSPTSTRGGRTSKGGSNKTEKNIGLLAGIGKLSYLVNMTRYYGRSLANVVQLAMDYVETQNLWQVANRNNLEMADAFIQKMNTAYGVSEQTLMNYQAIFKNMLSALGDLSDEISSGLSMQLTQMALDFSSLYNVTIPSAMQKFQAVLSGQVRPIRSISGYDITENTIFDLYAGAGGEKTMRQLSQIEKRLLRIVAVFDQMGSTGATGDMAKTIESASNQARIMSEQAQETLTWTGQLVLMWLNNAKVLQHINAFLITSKEIIKSIAYSLGYTEENFLDGLMTSAEGASEAVDDIQGKLLSFDKFESLNSDKGNVLGIDQTVLGLLEKINYETEAFTMQAQEMARQWLNALGFIDENGDGVVDITQKAKELLDVVKSIGTVLATLIGYNLLTKIGGLVGKITGLKTALSLLNSVVAVGVVYTFLKMVEAFKEGEYWVGALCAGIIGATGLIYALNMVKILSADSLYNMAQFLNGIKGTFVAVGALVGGIALFVSSLDKLSNTAKVLIPVLSALAGVIAAIAVAKAGMTWRAVMSAGAITTGIGMVVGTLASIPKYAEGGFPEDGLFFANSGEMVGNFSNGKTAVANNDQIVTGITQGVYSAMMAYNAQTRGQGGSGDVYLDGTKVGRVVAKGSHQEMVRVGLIKANS